MNYFLWQPGGACSRTLEESLKLVTWESRNDALKETMADYEASLPAKILNWEKFFNESDTETALRQSVVLAGFQWKQGRTGTLEQTIQGKRQRLSIAHQGAGATQAQPSQSDHCHGTQGARGTQANTSPHQGGFHSTRCTRRTRRSCSPAPAGQEGNPQSSGSGSMDRFGKESLTAVLMNRLWQHTGWHRSNQ